MGEDVLPKEVFVGGVVDQGGNVIKALKDLNVPVILCKAHCLNTSVSWGLGLCGSAKTCKNASLREFVGRVAAMVGVFSHSSANNDRQRALQKLIVDELEDLDDGSADGDGNILAEAEDTLAEIAKLVMAPDEEDEADTGVPTGVVNFERRNDTRWTGTWRMLSRVLRLRAVSTRCVRRLKSQFNFKFLFQLLKLN
jgi:hypothetical protein